MSEYVFQPGDKIIWVKSMSRKSQKDVPATFVRYAGNLVCIQPDREKTDDILPSLVRVRKGNIYLVRK
jgi:hypothetical protein